MQKVSQSDVVTAIEGALEIQPGTLREGALAEEVASWDSLGQLNILVALDMLFDGKIAGIQEMAEANSMPKILTILRQHSLL